MKRSFFAALLLLAACQTTPGPGSKPDSGGVPGSVPACVNNVQGYPELAHEIAFNQPTLAATGDRWFKINFEAPGAFTLDIQDVPEYGAFSYAVYDADSTRPVAAENFTDSHDGQIQGVTDTGEISAPGTVLINVTHTKTTNLTCEQYRLTFRRG